MKKPKCFDRIVRWTRKKFSRRPKARDDDLEDTRRTRVCEKDDETSATTWTRPEHDTRSTGRDSAADDVGEGRGVVGSDAESHASTSYFSAHTCCTDRGSDSANGGKSTTTTVAAQLAECQTERARLSRALAEAETVHAAGLAESRARTERLLAGREKELSRVADALAESETERGRLERRLRRSEKERGRLASAQSAESGARAEELLRLTDELARSEADRGRLERRLRRSEAKLAASRAQTERSARALADERRSQATRNEDERRRLESELAGREADRRVRAAECETLGRRVAARETRAAWLRADLARSESERERLRALLKERETNCRVRAAECERLRRLLAAAAKLAETTADSRTEVRPGRADGASCGRDDGRGPVVGDWTALEEESATTEGDRSSDSLHGWTDVDEPLLSDYGVVGPSSESDVSTSYPPSAYTRCPTDRGFYSASRERSTTTAADRLSAEENFGLDVDSHASTEYFSASSSSCSADTFYSA